MIKEIDMSEIKIQGNGPRLDTDVDDLIKSMSSIGQLQEIILNSENVLIAGGRRFSAAKKLGWEKIRAKVISATDLEQRLATLDENLVRMNYSDPEFEEALFEKKRILKSLGRLKSEGRPPANKGLVSFDEEVSRQLGVSKKTVQCITRRAELASDNVKEARKNNEIGSRQQDELVRFKKEGQDKLLPYAKNLNTDCFIELSKKCRRYGIDKALKMQESEEDEEETADIVNDLEELNKAITHYVEQVKEGGVEVEDGDRDAVNTLIDEMCETLRELKEL